MDEFEFSDIALLKAALRFYIDAGNYDEDSIEELMDLMDFLERKHDVLWVKRKWEKSEKERLRSILK